MTMTLTMINQHGIWQSSDLRLTDRATRKVVDDFSIKHVGFRCRDGGALLAYAGAGSVRGVHFSDWIRAFIRGESYTVDEALIRIREQATADLGETLLSAGVHHMFCIGAFLQGVPWWAMIRNFKASADEGIGPVERTFETIGARVAAGTGMVIAWPYAPSTPDLDLLARIRTKRPREPKQFSKVLANINGRMAASPITRNTVSPHCLTVYMPPSGDGGQSETHGVPEEAYPIVPPFLLWGIDTTDIMRAVMASALRRNEAGHRPADIAAIGPDAVTPTNLLKP